MGNINEQILSFLDAHAEEQFQYVVALCEQNSYTLNKKGTDQIAGMVCEHLNPILPYHEVLREEETGNHHIWRTASLPSQYIYLLGHMDTVFPPDHAFQKCFIDGDIMVGPGCGDMKGGLAVIIYALKALHKVNLLEQLPLTIIFNADEEIGSAHSRDLFLSERASAKICLVAECGGKNGEIVVSRNGKMGARLECFGQDRHVGFGTHEKASAVLELAHKIVALESLNACLPGVSLNVGKIEGGLSGTTIPAHATGLMDIRWEKEEHKETLLEKIQTILSTVSQPGCRLEFKILNSRPAMPLQGGTEALFESLRKAGQSIGQVIKPEHRRGTSDANFFGSAGVPTLDGLGPVSEKDHTPNEYLKISSLKERSALLACFLVEYGKKNGMIA